MALSVFRIVRNSKEEIMIITISHDEMHKESKNIQESDFASIKKEIEKEKDCKLQTVRHWHNKSQMFLMEEVEGVGNIIHATIIPFFI